MSTWRRIALERLPEYRSIIETAQGPSALWSEIWFKFQDAFRSGNDDLVQRVFDLADWCIESSDDISSATFIGFYQDIPLCHGLIKDLHRFLSHQRFLEIETAFRYHTTEAEFLQLRETFLAKAKRA